MILAELRVSRNDLSWKSVSIAENLDSSNPLNDSSSEKDYQSFICYPLASRGNFDVTLRRIEYWQTNHSENKKYRQEYLCELPGFSIEEILARGFKEDDVNFALNALRDLKLIEPSFEFRGNTRFIISDRKLHELLKNLWTFNEVEIPRMLVKWKYFEKHTTNEENRMKRLIGKHETNWIFRKSSIMRSQHNLKIKKFESIEEYNQYIKKEHFSYHRELALDASLEIFKGKARGNRTKVTTKEKRYDLQQYLNFLKEILFDYLKRLPISRDQDIDKFRMENKEILGRYIFLQPLLKEICPKAFEANDESNRM